jgi:ribose 5-phosphate isomerase
MNNTDPTIKQTIKKMIIIKNTRKKTQVLANSNKSEQLVVRNDIDVNDHQRLSNFTLWYKLM